MSLVAETIEILRARGATLRCSEVTSLLEALGMTVRVGRSGKHRIVQHDAILELAGDFDGGHGKDAEVKSCYTRDLRKLIEKYEDPLTDYLEKK